MAFPVDPLPVQGEMLIDGVWTDITSDVRGNNNNISILYGYQNEQSDSLTPNKCDFKLNNRGLKYSPRHPASVNYEKLPQNTPVRFWIDDPNGNAFGPVNAESYEYNYAVGSPEYVSTADKAVLDITGDIDVRADLWPESWTPATNLMLAHKYVASGNQRSWFFGLLSDGRLEFAWSPDGNSASRIFTFSTVVVPHTTRGAVRVVLDVNNGAAGNTVTFYYSSTISGSWTQLGAAVVTPATTSVFASTAPLHVGGGGLVGSNGGTPITDFYTLRGRYYRFQLYQNIAGTLRADANFGAQAAGATSWSDGLATPNTWSITANYGGITAGQYRFWGEIAELPQKADTTGTDIYVPVTATDIVRRLTQGADTVSSALFRYIKRFSTLLQYHPLEGGVSTTGTTGTVGAAINAPSAEYNDLDFGTDRGLPGSAGVVTFNSANSYIKAWLKDGASAPYASFMFAFKFGTLPASEVQIVSLGTSNATVKRWSITCSATSFRVRGYDGAGVEIGSLGSVFGGTVSPTNWILMRFQTHVSGGNVIAEISWCQVHDTQVWGFSSTVEFPGTLNGRFNGYYFRDNAAMNGFKLAHVMAAQEEILAGQYDFFNAAGGYDGELAGQRALRISTAEGYPLFMTGEPDLTEACGPEPRSTGVAILAECAKVDGGLLTTRPDAPAFHFITRASLLGQQAVELNQANKVFSDELEPVDDDANLRNSVNLNAPGGQTASYEKSTGTKSVDEVGRYESSYSLNADGANLASLAQYAVYLGTWDEIRLPSAKVQLQRSVFVADSALTWRVRQLVAGSVVRVVNPPAWMPPNDLELLVRGYREVMSNYSHELQFFFTNYGPYRSVNRTEGSSSTTTNHQASARNSSLNASVTSTATSFAVKTSTGSALWKTGSVSLTVIVGGEEMLVGTITGTSSPQTFSSVTRSVNGVIKAHSADEEVDLLNKFYASL